MFNKVKSTPSTRTLSLTASAVRKVHGFPDNLLAPGQDLSTRRQRWHRSRAYWAGIRKSRQEKEGHALRRVSWLWVWSPHNVGRGFSGKVPPSAPNRHTDEELSTAQKPNLTVRKGWPAVPCESQDTIVLRGGGTVLSSESGPGLP